MKCLNASGARINLISILFLEMRLIYGTVVMIGNARLYRTFITGTYQVVKIQTNPESFIYQIFLFSSFQFSTYYNWLQVQYSFTTRVKSKLTELLVGCLEWKWEIECYHLKYRGLKVRWTRRISFYWGFQDVAPYRTASFASVLMKIFVPWN